MSVSCHETRSLTDIIFETRTEHVVAEIKTCPDCHTETRGSFPDIMTGPLQYGQGIIAFEVHLLTAQMVPLHRHGWTISISSLSIAAS